MKRVCEGLGLIVLVLFFGGGIVQAQSASSNYQINESFIGPGGSLESNSSNFGTAPGLL